MGCENVYRILIGRHEGKKPLGRHRHRWEDNIGMNLREMVWVFIWIRLGTSGGRCEHSSEPSVSIKGRKWIFLRRALLHGFLNGWAMGILGVSHIVPPFQLRVNLEA
jgi:hypothetical protein